MLGDGKAQQWGLRRRSHRGSSHTASTARMEREMNADAHLAPLPFSPHYLVQDPVLWDKATHIQGGASLLT